MTRARLKQKIIDKFGTIANFCELADLDYTSTVNFLGRVQSKRETTAATQRMKFIAHKIKTTDSPAGSNKEITPQDRADIYLAVTQIGGSVKGFCNKYDEWSYSFVNNLVSSNGRSTNKSRKVIRFMTFLNDLK